MEQAQGENGSFGTAIIASWLPEGTAEDDESCSYWTFDAKNGVSFDWYMGAVWDKASSVKSAAQWEKEVRRVCGCILGPLRVEVR